MHTTLLTSQEMQELIGVDRSTVYRMAEDGRLPGVKVGRQWRFPADRVAAQLGVSSVVRGPDLRLAHGQRSEGRDRPDVTGPAASLPPDDAQSIADLIGELFGVMAVITDMDGRPLTTVANPCGYFRAIMNQPNAVEACLSQWHRFTAEPHVAPRWMRTHLGFLCARTFLWVDLKPVGMIIVGGVAPPDWPPPPEFVESIADEVGVSPSLLLDRVGDTWELDVAQQRRVVSLLPQFGDLVSQLVTARRRAPDHDHHLDRDDHHHDHDHDGDLTHPRRTAGVGPAVQYPVPQGGDRS